MEDVGYKIPKDESPQAVEAPREDKIRYPSIYLDNKVPDALMKKDVGDICRLEIIGKITRKGINEQDDKKRENMEIEIHKMGASGKSEEDYLDMPDEEKDNYDEKDMKEKKEEKIEE